MPAGFHTTLHSKNKDHRQDAKNAKNAKNAKKDKSSVFMQFLASWR